MGWGERLADVMVRISRVPELHEMDARQLAIYRKGHADGRAAARIKPPTAAEARMRLIEALEAEAQRLRAQVYSLRQDIAERDSVVPEKGVL